MPLFWIIVLALGGTALAFQLIPALAGMPPAAGGTSPGAALPRGVNASQAARAVQIALAVETDPARLRAFANILERYDRNQAKLLTSRAHQIELTQLGILTPFNPSQRERAVR